MMKASLSSLPEAYLTALQNYLERGLPINLPLAHALGDRAVAMGLNTLDIANIHDQALTYLTLPDYSSELRDDIDERAAFFFTEAIIPIEKTHYLSLQVSQDLNRLNTILGQCTLDLADSHREIKQEIFERETAEAALKISEEHSIQLLKEATLMEEHLHDMVRKIISANEEERKKMSHRLQDEMAQILLGINVRLSALKNGTKANHLDRTKEISITQRLVEESVKTIKRLACEFDIPHEK